jgi:hypothetical protein
VKIRFYIDPETGLPHIYRHQVVEGEVEDVLIRRARIARVKKALVLQPGRQERAGCSG